MTVVVRDVLVQGCPQVPRSGDQHSVGALGPDGPHPALGIGVRSRARPSSAGSGPAAPSAARRGARSRPSSTGGRPPLRGYVQLRRTSRRCQRSSVPGVTSRPIGIDAGSRRAKAASTARSAQSSLGRGFCRRSTATSWRSTSISASFDAADRASSANQPVRRTNTRYSMRKVASLRCCQPEHQCRVRTRRSGPCAQFWNPTGRPHDTLTDQYGRPPGP